MGLGPEPGPEPGPRAPGPGLGGPARRGVEALHKARSKEFLTPGLMGPGFANVQQS
jgi:hypothetical protein